MTLQNFRSGSSAIPSSNSNTTSSTSSSTLPSELHKRAEHPRFYFPDGTVVFRVENTLYRIHRYFFQRDSPVFAAMFSLPQPQIGGPHEGAPEHPENPIILEGVRAIDFDRFLGVLYPLDFGSHDSRSADEWASVLSLATRWDFSSLRTLAITQLNALVSAPAERIALAREYHIPGWRAPAYVALCTQAGPLSIAEGRLLGLDDMVRVAHVRETVRYPTNLKHHHDAIAALVRDVFGLSANDV
ncbi:BTB domain-containing protein [Mycena kentingensis (nom. inval.)]|nr:BTB domain-containing protein [Mycena kentingensis (nom. inval.)]